jgi:hypothetical protein
MRLRRVQQWRSLAAWRNTRLRCDCMGYHFPHRKAGGACEHSPRADYYHALRCGLPREEALLMLSVDQLERMVPL